MHWVNEDKLLSSPINPDMIIALQNIPVYFKQWNAASASYQYIPDCISVYKKVPYNGRGRMAQI